MPPKQSRILAQLRFQPARQRMFRLRHPRVLHRRSLRSAFRPPEAGLLRRAQHRIRPSQGRMEMPNLRRALLKIPISWRLIIHRRKRRNRQRLPRAQMFQLLSRLTPAATRTLLSRQLRRTLQTRPTPWTKTKKKKTEHWVGGRAPPPPPPPQFLKTAGVKTPPRPATSNASSQPSAST